MVEKLSNKSFINKLLYRQNNLKDGLSMIDSQQAYLIYTSILPNFLECINNKFGVGCIYDSRPYTLHVGEISFDMALTIITLKYPEVSDALKFHVRTSQYSKTWEYDLYKRRTLYMDLDRYHLLEKFIKLYNLEKSIISIEVEPGINTNQNLIKTVTFNEDVDYDGLLQRFQKFFTLKFLESDNYRHYYINYAFNWLQPTRQKKKRLQQPIKSWENDRFFFGLIMFLDCFINSSLNIVDLCSMVLAFCDFSVESRFSERTHIYIDELITSLLKKAACDGYINDGVFDFCNYAKMENLNLKNVMCCCYLLYTFQDHFHTLIIDSSIFEKRGLKLIKLIDPQIQLLELRENHNLTFTIAAQYFSGMDAKLFSSILQCGNVDIVILNAKVQWFNSNDPFVSDARNSNTIIILLDSSQLFMETFTKLINSMANTKNLILHFRRPNLQNFSILKNLNVNAIIFYGITITSSVLEELMECNFHRNPLICFYDAKIDNDVHTWLLFIKFNFLGAEIIEEETTWDNLFYSISLLINELENGAEFKTDSEFNEFELKNHIKIMSNTDKLIDLSRLKFTIDESKSRLEMIDKISNRQIELFDLKNAEFDFSPEEEEDGSGYEFYK